jgi:hypothetical protein
MWSLLFFVVVFADISIARWQKLEIQQRIAFADLSDLAFDNAGIDILYDEAHDGTRHWRWYWRQISSKKTAAILGPERSLDAPFRHRMGDRHFKARRR